jgi:hypothetical protein
MIKLIQSFSELSQMNDPDISSSDSEDKNSSEELNSQVPKWKVQMACST